MSDAAKRYRLDADPAEILGLLPEMDRVMSIARADGTLHERLGKVERAELKAQSISLSGACQDLVLNRKMLAGIEYDISSEMRGKIYPRLDLLDNNGEVVFSFVGLEGREAFEPHLEKFNRVPSEPRPRPTLDGTEPDLDNDPARPFIESLVGGAPVTIRLETSNFTQSWTGTVPEMRPIGGCFNILLKDFHLHLPAESLSGWSEEDGGHRGILLNGKESALFIGPAT